MALLIGAFMVHGVNPGPHLVEANPSLFWGIITSMYIGNLLLLILNVPLIGLFVRILRIPQQVLAPLIAVFCLIGAYSLKNDASGVLIVIVFGVIGYLMRKFEYDPAPLVLASVLGPLMENSLRQSMMLFRGDIFQILERPIALTFLAAAIVLLLSPLVRRFRKRLS
jgi:putative tricarboxylic transport membrane protein